MIIIGIVAFIVAFFQTIYNALQGNMGTKHVGVECTTGAQGMLVRVFVSDTHFKQSSFDLQVSNSP